MLIGWICLLSCVVASTMIWPVARWGLHANGNVRVMGFWTCLTSAAVCAVALSLQFGVPGVGGFAGEHSDVLIAGGVMAVAYAVGFYILIMRCLQTGPAGPTVTVNNSAMICGVLFGVLWLKPSMHTPWIVEWPNPWIVLGAAGTLAAMVLVGLGKTPQNADTVSPKAPVTTRWKIFLMLGGAFSGMSFMTQAYVGTFHPEAKFGFLFAGFGFGLAGVILLITMASRLRRILSWRELLGGAGVGVLNTVSIPLTMKAYSCFPAEIVLPVTVVTPIAFNLLIARVIWREHLSRVVWAGCILAMIAVAAIAYGSSKV